MERSKKSGVELGCGFEINFLCLCFRCNWVIIFEESVKLLPVNISPFARRVTLTFFVSGDKPKTHNRVGATNQFS